MNTGLKDRVVIVAAASGGLGRATAEAFAAEGARLAICSRNRAKINSAYAALRDNYHVEVLADVVDVMDEPGVARFVAAVAATYGRVEVCVANAGGPPAKGFLATTTEEWRRAFDLNLLSTVHFARAVLPHMQRARWGRFIAITSLSVKQPIEGLVYSNVVRAGVVGLMRSLSNEFGRDGITFNNVAPGYTATERLNELAETRARSSGVSPQEFAQGWAQGTAIGRIAEPAEVAAAIVYLASAAAASVTGQTLLVDGGCYKGV